MPSQPAFTSADQATVDENTTAVLTLTATDPEGAPVTFALSGGEDYNLFTVSGDQLAFTAEPDFEVPTDADRNNVYLVQVEAAADDRTGGWTQQDLTVTVANDPADDPLPPNEPPAFTNADAVSVDENTTVVLTLAAADPESGVVDLCPQRRRGSGPVHG